MYKNSVVRKTLLALAATATLFAALPSQASDRYCPPPRHYGYGGHDGYRHDRWDGRWDRGWDNRRDARWDARWDGRGGWDHRDHGWQERGNDRDRHDDRNDRDGDRRWH